MQSPRRIASAASATLCVPVAQADTMQTLWPIAPVSIASIPDVESTRAFAMNVGGTPPRALLLERDPGVEHQMLPAGARAVHDPDVLAVGIGDLEAGVGDGLLARGHAEPHRGLAAADRLRVHPLRPGRSHGPRRRPSPRSARRRTS